MKYVIVSYCISSYRLIMVVLQYPEKLYKINDKLTYDKKTNIHATSFYLSKYRKIATII
jgi:hypothetical protein